MKIFYFTSILLGLALMYDSVFANITVNLQSSKPTEHQLIPSGIVDYPLGSITVKGENEDSDVKGLVLRIDGLHNSENLILAIKNNGNYISDYYKLGSKPVDGNYLPNILALGSEKLSIEKNHEFEMPKYEK